MSILDNFIKDTESEVVEEVQRLVDEKGIKAKILEEAQQLATQQANHIINPKSPEPPKFEGLNLDDENMDEFCLVLDYLESIGLKFTPTVLKYESQNLQINSNRQELCERLKLRGYDRTPLLVQLIEERLKSLEED